MSGKWWPFCLGLNVSRSKSTTLYITLHLPLFPFECSKPELCCVIFYFYDGWLRSFWKIDRSYLECNRFLIDQLTVIFKAHYNTSALWNVIRSTINQIAPENNVCVFVRYNTMYTVSSFLNIQMSRKLMSRRMIKYDQVIRNIIPNGIFVCSAGRRWHWYINAIQYMKPFIHCLSVSENMYACSYIYIYIHDVYAWNRIETYAFYILQNIGP